MRYSSVYYWEWFILAFILAICGGVSWGIGQWFHSNFVGASIFFVVVMIIGYWRNMFLLILALIVGFPTLSGMAVASWQDSALMGWSAGLLAIFVMCALVPRTGYKKLSTSSRIAPWR